MRLPRLDRITTLVFGWRLLHGALWCSAAAVLWCKVGTVQELRAAVAAQPQPALGMTRRWGMHRGSPCRTRLCIQCNLPCGAAGCCLAARHAGHDCVVARLCCGSGCHGRLSVVNSALVSSCPAVCPVCWLLRRLAYVRHVRTLDLFAAAICSPSGTAVTHPVVRCCSRS